MKKNYVRAEAELIDIGKEKMLFAASMTDTGPEDGRDGYYLVPYPDGCKDCVLPADGTGDYCNIDCNDLGTWAEC